jgi:hypothetical protein
LMSPVWAVWRDGRGSKCLKDISDLFQFIRSFGSFRLNFSGISAFDRVSKGSVRITGAREKKNSFVSN